MTETLQHTQINKNEELYKKLKTHREATIELLKKRRVSEAVKYMNDNNFTLAQLNWSLRYKFFGEKQFDMFMDLFNLLIQFKFSNWWHATEEDASSTRGFFTYLNPADLKQYDFRAKQKAQEKHETQELIKAFDAEEGKFRE